jgi:tRNA A37 threonylcarbamoyladenosine modification protein TsaB
MILEIDSSDRHQKRVSLKEGATVVATKLTEGDILVAIKELLQEQKVNLKDLERVATVAEGTSFTGLRVGAALANALNFSTGHLNDPGELATPKYSSPPKITPKK